MGRIGRLFDNNNILQVNDQGLFTPSYELAKTLIEQKDKDLDDFEDARGKLQEKLAIAHMDTENDTKEARELLEAYQKELDNISIMAMNDRLNTGLYRRNLTDLQGRMMKDAQTGRWYDISRRAADEVAWKEQNAQIMKDDPSLYNRLHDLYKQEHEELGRKYHEDGISNWRVPWQAIVPKPNLTDDESLKAYSLIKENMWDKQRGMYIYNNKEVSEEEASRIAVNRLLSDKNVFGYAAQMARLGEKGYLDANGNLIPPMIEDVSGKPQINPLSAFAPMLQEVIDIIAFKQQTVRPDPVALAAADRAAAQMARRGSGKPEKEEKPSKSYLTRVANTPVSMGKIHDITNRINSGQPVTDADRDEMERIMHLQRNVPLQMRDANNNELTLGQLGVNDGLGLSKFSEAQSEKKEGRDQFSYMSKDDVDATFNSKALVMKSLSRDQLRTILLGRGGATSSISASFASRIGNTPFTIFSDMRKQARLNDKGKAYVNDDNSSREYRVTVMSDGTWFKGAMGQSYTMQDIDELLKADNVDVDDIIKFAEFIKDFKDSDFVNDPMVPLMGWSPAVRENWISYFELKAPDFNITPWMVRNDPRIYALLPAGQTKNAAKAAYKKVNGVKYSTKKFNGVEVESRGLADDDDLSAYEGQLYYEAVNSSADLFYGSIAGKFAVGLENTVKDYNDQVRDVESVFLGKGGREDMAEQFSVFVSDNAFDNSVNIYRLGTNEQLGNIGKVSGPKLVYDAIQNEKSKLYVSAGTDKGNLLFTLVTDATEGGTKSYQIVPKHPSLERATMAVVLRNLHKDDPIYDIFANDVYTMFTTRMRNRMQVEDANSISFFMPGNELAMQFKVFVVGNDRYYFAPCNENGMLMNENSPVHFEKGESELEYVRKKYLVKDGDSYRDVAYHSPKRLLNAMYGITFKQ